MEQQPPQPIQRLKTLSIGFGIVSFCIAIAIVGYLLTANKNQPAKTQTTITRLKGANGKIEGVLYDLTQAKNYEAFAVKNDLYVIDGKVQVTIMAGSQDYVVPTSLATELTRANNQIQAMVKIDKLLELANDPNVQDIRKPIKAVLLTQ